MTLAVIVLATVVFVMCGVVTELFRDVRQLREAMGILDRPLDIDIGALVGTRPSSHGLPAALDSTPTALVVFLSDRCGTCRSIAAGLGGKLPPLVWVVLEARTPESAAKFVEAYTMGELLREGRLVVDVDGGVAARVGLDITPAGFRVEDGRLARATTVPSRRYLLSILPTPLQLRPVPTAPADGEVLEAT